MISTSKRRAEHSFADRNTQQVTFTNWQELDWDLRQVSLVATKNIYKRKSLSTKKKNLFPSNITFRPFVQSGKKKWKKPKKAKRKRRERKKIQLEIKFNKN